MPGIVSVGASKNDYKLNIDATLYEKDLFLAGKSKLQRVQIHVDLSTPAFIDSERIMRVFNRLRAKDFKYYFYILDKMERNDRAVFVDQKHMRDFLGDNKVQTVAAGIDRLVQQGLLFRPENTRGRYIVNPVYAWKGNRLDYLDLSTFEDHTENKK